MELWCTKEIMVEHQHTPTKINIQLGIFILIWCGSESLSSNTPKRHFSRELDDWLWTVGLPYFRQKQTKKLEKPWMCCSKFSLLPEIGEYNIYILPSSKNIFLPGIFTYKMIVVSCFRQPESLGRQSLHRCIGRQWFLRRFQWLPGLGHPKEGAAPAVGSQERIDLRVLHVFCPATPWVLVHDGKDHCGAWGPDEAYQPLEDVTPGVEVISELSCAYLPVPFLASIWWYKHPIDTNFIWSKHPREKEKQLASVWLPWRSIDR